MQDATAQMALLQFMTAGLAQVAVPSTVHCDHLIQAKEDGKVDLLAADRTTPRSTTSSSRCRPSTASASGSPGSGIIHQVVLEQYAFPGGMMIGTDSHTPNAGGLGMVAIGVGGADAVDVMTGFPFNVRWPKLIGVHLTGALTGWSAPRTSSSRSPRSSPSRAAPAPSSSTSAPAPTRSACTGKATICNMGAEIGATTSLFAYDDAMARYLKATGREEIADAANAVAPDLRADAEVLADPADYFDQVIEIDLSTLEPLINGPHTPDLARPVSKLGAEARDRGLAARDQRRPRRLVHQLVLRGHHPGRLASPARPRPTASPAKTPLLITPGSEQVRATIERDGLLADLEAIGATVLANACGPCIGQWARPT